MAPKEVPSRKEQLPQYDPSSLFELSPAEQEVFDSLTPEEQTIFSVFRQGLLLSSGYPLAHVAISMAATHFFKLETKMLFASYSADEVPEFLKVIAAPRKHVKLGKKQVGDEVETSKRQQGIKNPWERWQIVFSEQMEDKPGYEALVLTSLADFMDQDFSLYHREDFKRRVTGNQPHASFLREFVINDQFDSYFDRHIVLLLQSWREVLAQHAIFYRQHIENKSVSQEVFEESQDWLQDKEKLFKPGQSEIEVEASEEVPFLAKLFFQQFKKYPTYLDATIMDVFDAIITHWKLKHPDQQFYPELGF